MKYLDLSLIKQHLNIEPDFTDDDAYLTHLGGVVEVVVEKHIDDSFDVLAADNGNQLPMPLKQAMLLLVGTYYANRENVSFAMGYEVPQTYNYLIDLYRNYGNGLDSQMGIIQEIAEMLKQQQSEIESMQSYISTDAQKNVTAGSGINVTGDLNKTISVGDIDLGDY